MFYMNEFTMSISFYPFRSHLCRRLFIYKLSCVVILICEMNGNGLDGIVRRTCEEFNNTNPHACPSRLDIKQYISLFRKYFYVPASFIIQEIVQLCKTRLWSWSILLPSPDIYFTLGIRNRFERPCGNYIHYENDFTPISTALLLTRIGLLPAIPVGYGRTEYLNQLGNFSKVENNDILSWFLKSKNLPYYVSPGQWKYYIHNSFIIQITVVLSTVVHYTNVLVIVINIHWNFYLNLIKIWTM